MDGFGKPLALGLLCRLGSNSAVSDRKSTTALAYPRRPSSPPHSGRPGTGVEAAGEPDSFYFAALPHSAPTSGSGMAAGGQPSHPHFGQREGGRGRRDLPLLTAPLRTTRQWYATRVTSQGPLLTVKELAYEVCVPGSNWEPPPGYWEGKWQTLSCPGVRIHSARVKTMFQVKARP